jgi:hypothetical protein
LDAVRRAKRAALLLTTLLALVTPGSMASAAVPQGVWMIDGKAALQIYDCNGLLCGRLRWLHAPRDTYSVVTEHTSSDQIVAHVYDGFTLVGETKTLRRTRAGTSDGWC